MLFRINKINKNVYLLSLTGFKKLNSTDLDRLSVSYKAKAFPAMRLQLTCKIAIAGRFVCTRIEHNRYAIHLRLR